MLLFQKPVVQLPKITSASGADLAAKAKLPPNAQALAQPNQTPGEYVHALEQNDMHPEAVKAMAHGMPERDSVWWACKSSDKVGGKLNPQEKAASAAAEAWVKNPSEANKAAAAEAASKTDFKGPGGWAAQAAAWSKEGAAPTAKAAAGSSVGGASGSPAVPIAGTAAGVATTAASAPSAPALTAAAVSGAILLAAGLVNRPAMEAPQKPAFQSPPDSAPKPAVPSQPAPPAEEPEVPAYNQTKMAKMLQPFLDLGKDIASGKNSWA